MKNIQILNTIALGIPLTLLLTGLIINDSSGNLIIYSIWSLIITGIIQITLGLYLLFKNPKNTYLQIYFTIVVVFFALWYLVMEIKYIEIISILLFPIPLLLAIYLSIIIYNKKAI